MHLIVETSPFLASAKKLFSEEEVDSIKDFLARNCLAGDLIPGTGGLRKIRWSREGMGKRGGARVIYYYYNERAPLFLIFAYSKAKREDMTPEQKKTLSNFAESLKKQYDGGSRG